MVFSTYCYIINVCMGRGLNSKTLKQDVDHLSLLSVLWMQCVS